MRSRPEDSRGSGRRRAALIATAVSVPATVVLALVFAQRTSPPAPTPRPSAPSRGAEAACRQLFVQLPDTLDGAPRNTPARGPFVAAWGKSPILLRCGVPRPTQLAPYSTDQLIGSGDDLSVNWLPVTYGDATVWTTVDRSVYVAVSVPTSYATPPINALSNVIARTLPAVCAVSMTAGMNEPGSGVLCTRRP